MDLPLVMLCLMGKCYRPYSKEFRLAKPMVSRPGEGTSPAQEPLLTHAFRLTAMLSRRASHHSARRSLKLSDIQTVVSERTRRMGVFLMELISLAMELPAAMQAVARASASMHVGATTVALSTSV